MTIEPSNEDRADLAQHKAEMAQHAADLAQQALILFTTQVCPSDRELSEDDPIDLIVNLCHYMRREGIDPYKKIQWALRHFDAEDTEIEP